MSAVPIRKSDLSCSFTPRRMQIRSTEQRVTIFRSACDFMDVDIDAVMNGLVKQIILMSKVIPDIDVLNAFYNHPMISVADYLMLNEIEQLDLDLTIPMQDLEDRSKIYINTTQERHKLLMRAGVDLFGEPDGILSKNIHRMMNAGMYRVCQSAVDSCELVDDTAGALRMLDEAFGVAAASE